MKTMKVIVLALVAAALCAAGCGGPRFSTGRVVHDKPAKFVEPEEKAR